MAALFPLTSKNNTLLAGFLRLVLYPFALCYGGAMRLRNALYDRSLLPVYNPDFPVIGIGNLSMGGSGKSPMAEYLVKLLNNSYRTATLSRGYGGKAKGFMLVGPQTSSLLSGDEPRQFAQKFGAAATVAIDPDRKRGIKLLSQPPHSAGVIILDDSFQHRRVKPGLNILLTPHDNLYYKDHLFPSGSLREPVRGAERADIIIVTKTEENITPVERRVIKEEISPREYQRLYFSYIRYLPPVAIGSATPIHDFDPDSFLLLFTGIADASPIKNHLTKKGCKVQHFNFSDHHEYSMVDIVAITRAFNELKGNKYIVTTEKDAMRLDSAWIQEKIQGLPLYYIPIEMAFHGSDEQEFNKQVLHYVKQNSRGNSLHQK